MRRAIFFLAIFCLISCGVAFAIDEPLTDDPAIALKKAQLSTLQERLARLDIEVYAIQQRMKNIQSEVPQVRSQIEALQKEIDTAGKTKKENK